MAATIDEAIDDCIVDIPAVLDASVVTRMGTWVSGVFGNSGIFANADTFNIRQVRNWYYPSLFAQGETTNDFNGKNIAVDIVTRVLFAVKYAEINGYITTAQRDATVTAYNTAWT